MSRRENAIEKGSGEEHREIGYAGGRALVEAQTAGVLAFAVDLNAAVKLRASADPAFLARVKEKLWGIAVEGTDKLRHLANAIDWLKDKKTVDPLRAILSEEVFRRQHYLWNFGKHGEKNYLDLTEIYEAACRADGLSPEKARAVTKVRVAAIRDHDATQTPRNASEIQAALAAKKFSITTKRIRDVAWQEFGLRLAPRGSPKGKPHRRRI